MVRRADLTQALTLAALVVLGLMTLFSTSRADFASQVGGVAAGGAVLEHVPQPLLRSLDRCKVPLGGFLSHPFLFAEQLRQIGHLGQRCVDDVDGRPGVLVEVHATKVDNISVDP